jgi:uncharacterized protein
VEKRILEIIACPLCKGKLHYDREANELICRFDKLAFPIHDGVPVMMEDKARNLQDKEK